MKKIVVLPGDGIGQEVCDAALPVFDLLQLPISLSFGDIGWECWCNGGDPVPTATWQQLEQADAVLVGAITSKGKQEAEQELASSLQGKGLRYVSPVIQLRQRLELFANVRPARHLSGARKPFHCVVIRENTEGLYAGIDRKGVPAQMQNWVRHPNIDRSGADNVAISVRLQTHFGLERLFKYAFDYARNNGHDRVTFADKPNVLRESGQFAADIFHSIAADYPGIRADIQNVDAVALWLVKRPETFGVIVAENMYGDILSDLAAGVMGGLGVAPSANFGNRICYFEPVHGSAPAMAGRGRANPAAMFLTISLMLRHLGFDTGALRVETAVSQVIREGRNLTYDLGGCASTNEMAQAVLSAVLQPHAIKRASILSIGDELLNGRTVNTNAAEIGRRLTDMGYAVGMQLGSLNQLPAIHSALDICLGQSDLIVVNGGLGPTPDDLTRDGVASALGKGLQLDDSAMRHIEQRLTGFGLRVHPLDRRQAMFPQGATILNNPNGAAPGFAIQWKDRDLLALPGPPNECLPMLDAWMKGESRVSRAIQHSWLLLGVTESDIAQAIGQCLQEAGANPKVSYRWRYPHVEVCITHFRQQDTEWLEKIDRMLAPHVVSKDGTSALAQLPQVMSGFTWVLNDEITGSDFAARLPASIGTTDKNGIQIRATATRDLAAPWQGVFAMQCQVQIDDNRWQYQIEVPHQGPEVVEYACEFLAWCLLRSVNAQRNYTSEENITV
jgi:isocitrate dehydrogenase